MDGSWYKKISIIDHVLVYLLVVEIPQFNWLMITFCRYNWQQFSVVTSDIAGHDDFIQAVRDKVVYFRDKMNFK